MTKQKPWVPVIAATKGKKQQHSPMQDRGTSGNIGTTEKKKFCDLF